MAFATLSSCAQTTKKVYDEDINPLEQIDRAVAEANDAGRFVVCQVGGNWCPWCLRFADFITNDSTISSLTLSALCTPERVLKKSLIVSICGAMAALPEDFSSSDRYFLKNTSERLFGKTKHIFHSSPEP